MSLHISVVSIEGNHLQDIPDVLTDTQYTIEDSYVRMTGVEAAQELLWHPDRDRVAKVAYESNGWTYVVDPEMVLMLDNVWLDRSRKWGTRVIGWLCEGTSNSYGLSVFQNGEQVRKVMTGNGRILTNDGAPLEEEDGLDWAWAIDADVIGVVMRLGADFDFSDDRDYTVFRLVQ